MGSRKSNQKFIAWAIVAIVLSLATNAYQWWHSLQLTEDLDLYKLELAAVESTQGQLEKDYELAIKSLEDLKGDNADLNNYIDQQKAELKTQKDKISNLIWKSKKLDLAKKEIENLKNQALGYVDQITKLKEENVDLLAENSDLITTTFNLKTEIEDISTQKDIISLENDSINLLSKKLTTENESLLIKATKASVVDIKEIDVTGYTIKESGKLSKKKKAKNIQMLKVCFILLPNEISEQSTESFLIRIISPTGETMFKKQLGAGIFTKASDGTDTKFTFTASFQAPKTEELVCVEYEPKEILQKGLYQMEVYNKGYLSGIGSFQLK